MSEATEEIPEAKTEEPQQESEEQPLPEPIIAKTKRSIRSESQLAVLARAREKSNETRRFKAEQKQKEKEEQKKEIDEVKSEMKEKIKQVKDKVVPEPEIEPEIEPVPKPKKFIKQQGDHFVFIKDGYDE